ncbi:MAG: FMN-dependent NADH-azoreductase [Clostridiaceae bacterium]
MKKLLYITVNSKPENLSASKTVGKAFVNRFIEKYPEFKVEELDLYKEHIPRLEYQYFESRNCIVNEEATNKLPEKDQKEVEKIVELCNQFIDADVYVIAAPMWSLSFPAPLKEYIDCIVQVDKTITFPEKGEKPKGLLNDKPRTVIYIQSSGGNITWMMRPMFNKGLDYIEDIMKFMGMSEFERLLVDGTGTTEEERIDAIDKAKEKIDGVIEKVYIKETILH